MAEQDSVQPRQINLGSALNAICSADGPTLVDKILFALLIFVPIAFVVGFSGAGGGLWVFLTSALAIVPMAKLLGTATEELASRVGSGLGGLLNSTFGNATELIIAFFALQAGLTDVVKASLTGSIIGNLLFVLGLAIVAGGVKRPRQTFNAVAVSASSSQLGVATIALVIPAVFAATTPAGLRSGLVENLSLGVAGVLLLAYLAQLIFTLRTHPQLYTEEAEEEVGGVPWPIRKSLLLLAFCTIIIAFLSEFLVSGVQYLTSTLGWTDLFVGVILIALIGNAAENMAAVSVAMKNKMNLSMSIAMGSSTQIALFVAPVLVFVGFFMGGKSELTLLFQPFEIAAIVLAVMIVDRIARDGESNWLEGVQLLAVYTIFAVAFFLHPLGR